MTTRIVLADDDLIIREGVRALLETVGGVVIQSVAGSFDELMAAVREHSPDVVVTDIRMPPSHTDEGIRAAREIRGSHPATGVVVLSQFVEPEYAVALFADGSEGLAYLLKERVGDADQLAGAIERVTAGGSVVDPKVVDALVEGRIGRESSVLHRLTEREREVLATIATGVSNSAAAEQLYVSERAIEKHINSIFTKLDLPQEPSSNRRVRAVLLYLAESDRA